MAVAGASFSGIEVPRTVPNHRQRRSSFKLYPLDHERRATLLGFRW